MTPKTLKLLAMLNQASEQWRIYVHNMWSAIVHTNTTISILGFKFREYYTTIVYFYLSIFTIPTNSVQICVKLLENYCNLNDINYFVFLEGVPWHPCVMSRGFPQIRICLFFFFASSRHQHHRIAYFWQQKLFY